MTRITQGLFFIALIWITATGAASLVRAGEPARIDSLTFRSGFAEFKAEGVEFEGLNLSPESLEILIHGADSAAQAKALATLDASVIRISKLREAQTVSGQTSTTLFSNVVLTDIKAGVAGTLRTDQINFGSIAPQGQTSTGAAGSLALDQVDLSLILGFGAALTDAKSSEFRTAYRLARVDKIALQGAEGPTVTIDKIEVHDARLRKTGDGFAGITERLLKHQSDPNPPSDAELSAMMLDVVDLFSALSTGSIEISGIAIREVKTPTNFATLTRFTYQGGIDVASSYRIEGVDLAVDDFRMKIGSIAQSDIKISQVLDGLRKALSKPNANPSNLDPVIFAPMIGHIELNNLSIDADLDGIKHSGLRSFVMASDIGADGLPTGAELSFAGLTGPLPSDNTEPAVQTLMGLGYRYIDASGTIKVALDQKAQNLTLLSSISSENMAGITLSGTLGNVSASALAANPNNAPLMLLGASLKSFALTVENRGIAERLIDQQAIKTKRTPAEIRASYASAAAASLQIYLGMSPNAKTLTQSIVNFVGKPNRLMIAAQSKSPSGVTISDTATGAGPAAILDLFDLQIEQK